MGWYASAALLTALVPFLLAATDFFRRILERRRHRYPPGPIPLPFVGNALSINTELPWLTYTEWRERYGDIMYVRLMDTEIIVLNTTAVATELLEKRSGKYSGRPIIPTLTPYGHDCNFVFAQCDARWKFCRRIFQQTFGAEATLGFRPMQLRRARQLAQNMFDDPDEYYFHFQTFTSAISMNAVYDYDPTPRNDPMVSIIDNYLQAAMPGLAPGKILLLKVFPSLLRVPEWLPGSWIRREAKEAYAWRNKMVETPYQYVQKRMESKEHVNPAMVSDHIARMQEFKGAYRSEYETNLKDASATAFLAAAETTSSALMTFTLTMVQNPHVWKRAQMEIDTIVGTDRLPDFDDKPFLPYVEAVIRESFRWRPVTPVVMHAVTQSDVYEGYYIPEGATIVVNAWGISRDEARYPNAYTFMPERFLDAEGNLTDDDPRDFVFGFGRRKCPGRHIADASVWCAVATMLATLDFDLAKDEDGNDITFTPTFTNGMTDHPDPFPCRLAPRSGARKDLLASTLAK